MTKRLILLTAAILVGLTASAQLWGTKTKTVVAQGTGIGEKVKDARLAALESAKNEALKEAGIWESVNSIATVHIGNGTQHVESISNLVLNGMLRIINEEVVEKFIRDDMISITLKIKAEVKQEIKPDPSFNLQVSGFKEIYHDGDALDFAVQCSKNCYLRIFWFDKSPEAKQSGDLFYPNPVKYHDGTFDRGTLYHFPNLPEKPELLASDDYVILHSDFENNNIETVTLLIVAFKKDPGNFVDEVSYENVLKWLFQFDADEYTPYWQLLTISK